MKGQVTRAVCRTGSRDIRMWRTSRQREEECCFPDGVPNPFLLK